MKKSQKNGSESGTKNWNKLLFIVVAVMFAVAMVFTYLMPLFTAPRTAQTGDLAVIGYTIRDEAGMPVLTTDQQLVQDEQQNNHLVVLTSRLEIPVGMAVSGENIAPVPIYYPQGSGFDGFGLLGFETNAISAALVGMHAGESRSVRFDYGQNDLTMNISAENAAALGIEFSNATVGDKFTVGLTTTPEIPLGENSTPSVALRIGEVVEKTAEGLVIRYHYAGADLTLQGVA
ncbi:hypothetical protein FGU65_10010 [Methanoculleus sp. FWC-SCC1]|uniref:Uncharacterized protein n=1 Tax=Methanoculleus frigidifontis TaxID=2584085 RepID=A0ABT8MBA7_9EURY|nr:hypothetical protein [Methanoculleus sp. FWC-SCC1]MDN7025219.1 hypothetical protein [Methanoculleus sp. FWC-SCC1]